MPPLRVRFSSGCRNRLPHDASNTGEATMSESTAQFLVTALGLYASAGVLFAVPFTWWLAGRLDPAARHGTWGFRVLALPGAAAFWPYLLVRLATGATAPPDEWTAHRAAAR
jgi:hypothetical protein